MGTTGPALPLNAVRLPSPVDVLVDERLNGTDVQLLLKRDDLVHPDVPGNKWRKLKYNLEAATARGQQTILTFGGAYSNHIRATAAAGAAAGFRTIGVIRGEQHAPLNPVLAYATAQGMQLTYLDRDTYRQKHAASVVDRLTSEFGDFYLLPEGGSNAEGVRGCVELAREIDVPFDILTCSVGTGGTLAGLAIGVGPDRQVLGFSALKGGGFLTDDIRSFQADHGQVTDNWDLDLVNHFGGYAKRTPELDNFVADFHRRHGIQLDWVYEGKMMSGLFGQIRSGRFERGTTIVALIAG